MVALAALVCAGCFDAGATAVRTSAACGSLGDAGYVECKEGRTMERENAELHGQSCALQLEQALARNGDSERQCEKMCDLMHEGEHKEERECERQCEADRDAADARARGLQRKCESE